MAGLPSYTEILTLLSDSNPHQPATALFGVEEIFHLLRSDCFPQDGSILDLGCGDGSISKLLQRLTPARREWIGLEIDEEELATAQKQELYSNLIRAEEGLEFFKDRTVDYIFSNSVLEHIADLAATLTLIDKALKPLGKFVFTVPSEYFEELLPTPNAVTRFLLRVSKRENFLAELNTRLAHFRYLTPEQWDSTLNPLGLRRTHLSYYLTGAQIARWLTLSNYTSGLLYHMNVGREVRPIQIQRSIGVRGRRIPLPVKMFGRALITIASRGVFRGDVAQDISRGACALYVYERVN